MGDVFKQHFRKLQSKVTPYLLNSPLSSIFDLIETKTGIESTIIAIALFGIVSIYLVFGWGNDFVCNFIGLLYPAYASLMTVRSPGMFDEKQLLTYWVIYASLGTIEYFLHDFFDLLLFYWLAKSILLIWFLQSSLKINSDPQTIVSSKGERTVVPKKPQVNVPARSAVLSPDVKWIQNGVTVAGGNGNGSELHQLWAPFSICVDDDQNVYVADPVNSRIVEWKRGAREGRLVAHCNEGGSAKTELKSPQDVIIDKQTDSFIISDSDNRRVVRWGRRSDAVGETIISNIDCKGLTMDENGSIYVADNEKHQVRRYNIGDDEGTVVAGGNGQGHRLDQFDSPFCVFVDQEYSVYVSDENNHRVMKWKDGGTEGVVVAGGQGQGDSLSQLNYPQGVLVDQSGTVYVADHLNGRVMRWMNGATQGEVILGGNGDGEQANQLSNPKGLAFDTQGNLYVVEQGNARAQRFNIAPSS